MNVERAVYIILFCLRLIITGLSLIKIESVEAKVNRWSPKLRQVSAVWGDKGDITVNYGFARERLFVIGQGEIGDEDYIYIQTNIFFDRVL